MNHTLGTITEVDTVPTTLDTIGDTTEDIILDTTLGSTLHTTFRTIIDQNLTSYYYHNMTTTDRDHSIIDRGSDITTSDQEIIYFTNTVQLNTDNIERDLDMNNTMSASMDSGTGLEPAVIGAICAVVAVLIIIVVTVSLVIIGKRRQRIKTTNKGEDNVKDYVIQISQTAETKNKHSPEETDMTPQSPSSPNRTGNNYFQKGLQTQAILEILENSTTKDSTSTEEDHDSNLTGESTKKPIPRIPISGIDMDERFSVGPVLLHGSGTFSTDRAYEAMDTHDTFRV